MPKTKMVEVPDDDPSVVVTSLETFAERWAGTIHAMLHSESNQTRTWSDLLGPGKHVTVEKRGKQLSVRIEGLNITRPRQS